jgi:hypothetical protein
MKDKSASSSASSKFGIAVIAEQKSLVESGALMSYAAESRTSFVKQRAMSIASSEARTPATCRSSFRTGSSWSST